VINLVSVLLFQYASKRLVVFALITAVT